jgi:hypothetical protein
MQSFGLVYAGSFDGGGFRRPDNYDQTFHKELKPISENFEIEALRVNGLDRTRLCVEGESPERAMTGACRWVKRVAGAAQPVLVAYPLNFGWPGLVLALLVFHALLGGRIAIRPRTLFRH